jgi:S-adenosylmethionine-dependent methyltransferase
MPDPHGLSFTAGRTQWLDRLDNLRNVARQELVTRQLAAHLPDRPARVADIGAGQGTQALRLAALGHHVTAVEPDPAMRERLAAACAVESPEIARRVVVRPGGLGSLPPELDPAAYDVVLCHGVLMYLSEAGPALAELAGLVAPGGILSLVFRNAEGIAMRPALRRDWAEVRELIEGASRPNPVYRNEIGVLARADHLSDIEAVLADRPTGALRTVEWYGVRVATDGIDAGELVPPDPADLAELLDAEELLGRTDPYRRVATLAHLVSRRDGTGPTRR